jgi:hypothetical protein
MDSPTDERATAGWSVLLVSTNIKHVAVSELSDGTHQLQTRNPNLRKAIKVLALTSPLGERASSLVWYFRASKRV